MSKGASLGSKEIGTNASELWGGHTSLPQLGSHSWMPQPSPARGKESLLGSAAMPHATVCKRKPTLPEQCSSVRAKSHPSSFQILSQKILPENSSYRPLLSSLGHVAGRKCTPSKNPSHAPGQLLGSSIYLLSKFRQISILWPSRDLETLLHKLMVGKFKFSYSPSTGGGFSCHEAHSSEHPGSARPFQKHVFMVVPYFSSNVLTWVANTV